MSIRTFTRAGLAVVALAALPVAAHAQSAHDYYAAQTMAQRLDLQANLMWIGAYGGDFDGIIGAGSIAGIETFQRSHGFATDGILTPPELDQLHTDVLALEQGVGLTAVRDRATGATIEIPQAYTPHATRANGGTTYSSDDGNITISTFRAEGSASDFIAFYNSVRNDPALRVVTDHFTEGSFGVTGARGDQTVTTVYVYDGSTWSGFTISYASAMTPNFYAISMTVITTFQPFPSR